MNSEYQVYNMHNITNEEYLPELLTNFSCPPNREVEHFLLNNSMNFTKKHQSVTYLVFRAGNMDYIMGYFSLTIKPISVRHNILSKTMRKKISRTGSLNMDTGTYTTSAYLIAQLGKNFSLPKSERISGIDLLTLVDDTTKRIQHLVGGVVEFLECDNNPFLRPKRIYRL